MKRYFDEGGDKLGTFLIQTVDGQVKHDFCFTLIEAINYQNFFNVRSHSYWLSDIKHLPNSKLQPEFSTYTPCGTVEFVQKYLDLYHDIHITKPINIPPQLLHNKYTKRSVKYIGEGLYSFGNKKFIKSHDKIKEFNEISDVWEVPKDKTVMVSDVINIESEWRAFVFESKLVGLQNYLGEFTMFPDVRLIENMIKDYTYCPPAYTLDVGINSKDGTFIIECHNFYSCGLYGFNNNRIIPQMLIRSFRHLIEKGQ